MKGRKTTFSILIALVSLSIPAAFSENDDFSVDYTFKPYIVGDQWMVKDTQIQRIPGEPLIPYRTARILLPEGAVLKDVKVKHGNPIVQKGFELPWSQSPCTFSGTPTEAERNEETYNSDNLYPGTLFEVVGVKYFRGFATLHVILYPVQYQPKSGTVHFYKRLTVEIKFGKGMKNKLYRGLEADKKAVAGMVDNPEMVETYEDGETSLATEEYIIITNDTMQSAFQQLAKWKTCFVDGAYVYTVSWICSNYSGVDNQEKIRNFIIDKYTNNGLKYVLLGGDTAAVPYRGFYVSTGGYTEDDLPADMYYAHLDGTWDNDGDGIYGEPGDQDWYAEVAVGRAPVETVVEAQNFVNKVITYEQAPKEKVCQFHQSQPFPIQLARDCESWISSDYVKKELFEADQQVTKLLWKDAWTGEFDGEPHCPPLTFLHIGLGGTDYICINNYPQVIWPNSDVSSLTNTDFFPVFISAASFVGDFRADDCLAEELVNDDAGAIAAIANASYHWDCCNEFVEAFFRALFDDGKEHLGDALNQGKTYMVSSAQSEPYCRWCFYAFNLIGDPETPILTKRDMINIYPSTGSVVSGTVTVFVCAVEDIDEVKFYVDGSLTKDDTTAPFSWDWDTTEYSDGSHTVAVEIYIDGLIADTDSATVTVDNIPEPYVTITNPSEGQIVSGTVTCTADSNCDSVRWYIDGSFRMEDTTAPFQYSWDTTMEAEDANHTVEAEGYISGSLQDIDIVPVIVDNEGECSGTVLLSLLVLFGVAGTHRRC